MKKTVLFGAGAEANYKLPLGGEFLYKTLLEKNTSLYEALDEFYKNIDNNSFYPKYSESYHYMEKRKSVIKNVLDKSYEIYQADNEHFEKNNNKNEAHKFTKINSEVEKFLEKIKNGEYSETIENKNKTNYEKMYNDFFELYKNEKKDKEENYFQKYLKLNGIIESDFNTIINPNKYGAQNFWKLVNFYWAGFFAVFMPLLAMVDKKYDKPEFEKEDYLNVLKNLIENINYIEECNFDCASETYYKYLDDSFHVATMNYTPICEKISSLNVSYLAGSIRLFERPDQLELFGYNEIKNNIMFPFIMCQSPVKPIVFSKQLKEYNDFINNLNNSEYMVIIGYNLNDDDNHVNAIIREFLKTKLVIIFEYASLEEQDNKKETTKEVINKEQYLNKLYLKEGDNAVKNLRCFRHDGNAEQVFKKIKEIEKEII